MPASLSKPATAPVTFSRKSYTREEKIGILNFYHDGNTQYRTCKEFNLNTRTLERWIKNEQKIRGSKRGTRKMGSGRQAFYPDMEAELYKQFSELRVKGLKVKGWWFTLTAKKLMNEMHPGVSFQYSDSWFTDFKKRHDISYRRATNKHQHSADDKRGKVEDFHRFVRKVRIRHTFHDIIEKSILYSRCTTY